MESRRPARGGARVRAARGDAASAAPILDRVDCLLGVADRPRGGRRFTEQRGRRLVRREGRRRRPPLASIGPRYPSRWRMRPTSSSVDAVRCGALATPSPISILRRALKRTPLHHQRAHTLISTELMRRLMSQEASSPEIHDEPKALFQKLISRFRGALNVRFRTSRR
jgi:hypothetical protein